MTETTYTMFVNTDNIKDIETLEEYLILAQKPCLYSNGKYSVIAFTVLDQTPECYDPETILEVMGGLVLHEDGSNCFLMLEDDIDEVNEVFCWDSAGSILMGELLSADDKKDEIIEAIKKNTPKIRYEVGKRIRLRLTPELRFIPDDSLERGAHVTDLINKISRGEI